MIVKNIPQIIISFIVIFYDPNFCQATPATGKLVSLAHKNDFPYVVSLSYNSSYFKKAENSHTCTGTLITRTHVLTAAHCVESLTNYFDLLVRVGSIDLRSALIYEIKWWATYNDYAGVRGQTHAQIMNDVAIVKLFKSVSSCIPLGILTKQPNKDLYGQEAKTAGWGLVENDVQPRFLRTADLILQHNEKCLFDKQPLDSIDDKKLYSKKLLCSLGGPDALIQCGDSGGPVVLNKREIVGVNVGHCSPDDDLEVKSYQNIHSSINYYREFIQYVAKPGCILFAYSNKTLC